MHSLNILFATSGSTALKGSSNKIISESEYTALAKLISAFCPPDMFIPLSPIVAFSLF